MKKQTTRFLAVSLAIMIVACVGAMAYFAMTMSRKTEDTISEVGTIYMSGMSEKIAMHFGTTINLRVAQIETIMGSVPTEGAVYSDQLVEDIAGEGKLRGFDYLAFYDGDGNLDMIYGEQVELINPEPFLKSLKNGDKKVSVGQTASGEAILLMGIPANYPMPEGGTYTALVAGLPVEYINEILSLDVSSSLTYSHIIRRDGSFVIRNADVHRDNYFTRIRDVFSELNGKNAEQYVTELQAAMEKGEDYTTVLLIGSERRHMYCTPLPYSEWYLVTIMPYGLLDETVSSLSSDRTNILLICIAVILMVLLIIFALYFRMTQKQIYALDAARQEAIHATQAKSEFLSNMSHDIRTPMNAIVGMTAIATANINDTQQVRNCLKKITLSSKHLLGLINDVLDMSKIESGKMTLNPDLISLREVMDSIVSIIQPQIKAKNQQFDVYIHDIETENVYCDSVRLNQVLLNFLSNALKFTPEGGSIYVSLHQEPSPAGDDYVRVHLYVKDTGIGMSPEFKEKVFESFTREDSKRVHKTEGTGLGMAITKYIIDAMGGQIEVESDLGKGTQFHVVLDMEKAPIQEEEMLLPNWNMLVVDDDEQLCKSTVISLEAIGVNAEWTLDGESAVRLVEEHHGKHEDYQVVLLDWKLPGMDGIQTAREIRKHVGEDVPILLISAYDWSDIEQDAREAGVTGFISKPLFKSTLFYGLKPYTEAADQPSEQHIDYKTDFGGIKVLVAEDNDLNWEIADTLLSQLGLDMERAENGHICVEKFSQSPVGHYAAILMDIRMPVMTGYEAARAIRSLERSDADIPIIAMTADAFAEDIQQCLDYGMNAHIAKPIDVREVSRLLEKYMK